MHPITSHPYFPLVSAALIVALLFLFFFPPMFVSIDEHQYLKNALLLQNGELRDADPLLYCGGTYHGETYLSSYQVGRSFSLIPFTWFAFPFVMLSGLLIHLINMGLFALILRRLHLSPWLVGLMAFYPAFLWESRTLFSEIFALTLILAGAYFYLDTRLRSKLIAGVLLGLTAFVRQEAVLIALAFAIAMVWKERHTLRKPLESPIIWFIGGGAIAAIALFGWNAWYLGNPLSTTLGNPDRLASGFPRPHFFANMLRYITILLLAFPLMLVSLAKPFKLRLEIALATVFTLILFAQTDYVSTYSFFSPLTITARIRYLIPVIGLLLIAYAHALGPSLQRHIARFHHRKALALMLVIGVIFVGGTIALHVQHQSLVEKRAVIGVALQTYIPSEAHVIGSSDDCIYFLPIFSGNRTYSRVDDPSQSLEKIP